MHPSTKTIWLAFVVIQVLDGMLTVAGMYAFGTGVEANPLIEWYAGALGPAAAVCGAKLFAVGCGAILYVTARYRTMAALAALYVLCAIAPWLHLLSRT